ncbi:MAG: hypothetical protein KDK78_09840 [Chlamydiia bacterium]|nr:hypothetical protein [Chlamydiia bacterium]
MHPVLYRILALILICSLSSCAPYKMCTPCTVQSRGTPYSDPCAEERRLEAAQHWLYSVVPRHRCQIRWYDLGHWTTWALFGNDDDGLFGEEPSADFKPSCCPTTGVAGQWALRNPLHNMFFYVLGTAYCTHHSELALLELSPECVHFLCHRCCAETVFSGDCNGLFIGLHGGLPFVSLHFDYGRRFEFYFGWRERGNLGIKFRPAASRPPTTENCLESEETDPVQLH